MDEINVELLIEDLEKKVSERKEQRFATLQSKIAKLRDKAVNDKKASKIETIWLEDIEYTEGIDDYNRDEVTYIKPHYDGSLERKSNPASNQCTAFFNITRQFVEAASARAGDIQIPSGGWNWGIKKTPVDEDINPEQKDPVNVDKTIRGEKRIKDWLVESRYHKEYRRAIDWAAKIGTGVLRAPYAEFRKNKAMVNGVLVEKEEIIPAVKCVNPFNIFPDMDCLDDIHKGDYMFEKDRITRKGLSDLRDDPSYMHENLEKVLKEKPIKSINEDTRDEGDIYEIWFYTGNLDINDMDLVDERFCEEPEYDVVEGEVELQENKKEIEYKSVQIVMVNNTIIKAHMNPLVSGNFPYYFLCWQRRDDSPFGIGVARQGRVAQQLLLSSARNLVDNMGLSSMPMIGMRREGVTPADGKWELAKGKVWWLTDDNIRNINEAIQVLAIPSMQQELQNIMLIAGKMFEDATGVNSLLQGQQGAAPDTVGGMELLHKNASALLRRIGRICDEDVTEPLILNYYDWLLLYGEDDEKGDFEIEAIGASVLVEREIQEMQAQTLLQYSQDPSYGLSKSKIMAKIVDDWGFSPSEVMMDEEEKQQLQEAQQQQQPDPKLAIAQMNVDKDMAIAEQRNQVELQRIKTDTDRDTVYSEMQASRDAATQQYNLAKLELEKEKAQLDRDLEMLKYAQQEKISLDKVKADLSKKAMDIQATKELASLEAHASRLPTPPVEPPQQAPVGKSFTN